MEDQRHTTRAGDAGTGGPMRIAAAFVACALGIGLVAVPPPAALQPACPPSVADPGCVDVAATSTHGSAIACVAALGIAQGTSPTA